MKRVVATIIGLVLSLSVASGALAASPAAPAGFTHN